MNQALMVVATKSCSNYFPKLSSKIIYIFNLNFEIERERVINLHKALPFRLVWSIRSHVYQAPKQAVESG